MRTVRRIIATAAAAVALFAFMLSLSPAAQAAKPGPPTQASGQIPADCTLTTVDQQTRSLTCTDRPATQRWHLYMYCIKWVNVEDTAGNIVTGNGTSTARCPYALDPAYPAFIVDP